MPLDLSKYPTQDAERIAEIQRDLIARADELRKFYANPTLAEEHGVNVKELEATFQALESEIQTPQPSDEDLIEQAAQQRAFQIKVEQRAQEIASEGKA